jgi:hypothetical protein
MPAGRLPAAFLAHTLLLLVQAAWRMARLNFLPFFLGKLDAVRSLPAIRQGRKHRAHLARTSIGPAHFPMKLGSAIDVVNHLTRPREHSAVKKNR